MLDFESDGPGFETMTTLKIYPIKDKQMTLKSQHFVYFFLFFYSLIRLLKLKIVIFSKAKTADVNIVTSENSWDDVTRSEAHRRAIQKDILNHFKDSTTGDVQMEALRKKFTTLIAHFNKNGHLWLKPQKLAVKLNAVRQVFTRNEFERRFLYNNPTEVCFDFGMIFKINGKIAIYSFLY